MKIESSAGIDSHVNAQSPIRKNNQPEAGTAAAEVELSSQGLPDTEANTGDAPRGVIRNILEGHYKGVAAVRLRINFYDELSAIEEQAQSTALTGNADAFKDTLDSSFGALSADESVTAEQAAALNELKTAFSAESQKMDMTNAASFLENCQQNVMNLLDSVKALFSPISTEATGAGTTSADQGELSPGLTAFNSFETKILSALSGLQSTVESVNVLPELPPPSGNGAAYDKFLQVYSSMGNVNAPAADDLPDISIVA
jgi:hypothetical protein